MILLSVFRGKLYSLSKSLSRLWILLEFVESFCISGMCLRIVDIKKNCASKLSPCFAITAFIIKSLPFIGERSQQVSIYASTSGVTLNCLLKCIRLNTVLWISAIFQLRSHAVQCSCCLLPYNFPPEIKSTTNAVTGNIAQVFNIYKRL